MKRSRSLTPWSHHLPCDHGVQRCRAATALDERESMSSEYGRGARILSARRYLGLERKDMAEMLDVRDGTLQRWENGQDPIPSGIWDDIDALFQKFDEGVAKVLAIALESEADVVRIRIWRTRKDELPPPAWWQRIVSEAMRREPRIEPVYPQDDKDD